MLALTVAVIEEAYNSSKHDITLSPLISLIVFIALRVIVLTGAIVIVTPTPYTVVPSSHTPPK